MSFVKVNLVLKTDRPTDRPTYLSIEATCRHLKSMICAYVTDWIPLRMLILLTLAFK